MRRIDPWIGKSIDQKYTVESLLGAGAMGSVYLAKTRSGEPVAIKIMQDAFAKEPSFLARFEREAKALFAVQHPHIVRVQGYGVTSEQTPYLVTEYLNGKSLTDWIDSRKLDPGSAIELGRQVLSGLAHAHEIGILHRDIKPDNIVVLQDAMGGLFAKLLDFGLVKFVEPDKWGSQRALTAQGTIFGSPAYMSPEQGSGIPTDTRSDVYSMGVVMFELLTGKWPFQANSQGEMLRQHLMTQPPKLSAVDPNLQVQPALEHLIKTALAKKGTDRYQDAVHMLRAMDAIARPMAWNKAQDPAQMPSGVSVISPVSSLGTWRSAPPPPAHPPKHLNLCPHCSLQPT